MFDDDGGADTRRSCDRPVPQRHGREHKREVGGEAHTTIPCKATCDAAVRCASEGQTTCRRRNYSLCVLGPAFSGEHGMTGPLLNSGKASVVPGEVHPQTSDGLQDTLMHEIRAARNVSNLRRLLVSSRRQMNQWHYRAGLSQLSWLLESEDAPEPFSMDAQHVVSVIEFALSGITFLAQSGRLSPSCGAGASLVLARLHHCDPHAMQEIALCVSKRMSDVRPRHIGGLLLGYARLHVSCGLRVDAPWTMSLLEHMRSPANGWDVCDAADLSRALNAVAMLKLQPPPGWLDGCLAALKPHISKLPHGIPAACLWAAAGLNAQPGEEWLQAVLSAPDVSRPQSARSAARVLLSLSRLQCRPNPAWVEGVLDAVGSGGCAGIASIRDAAALLHALRKLRYRPTHAWARIISERATWRLETCNIARDSGHAHSRTAADSWATRDKPSPDFVAQGNGCIHYAAQFLLSIGYLRIRASDGCYVPLMRACVRHLNAASGGDLAMLLLVPSAVRMRPPPSWMQEVQEAVMQKLATFDSGSCTQILGALAAHSQKLPEEVDPGVTHALWQRFLAETLQIGVPPCLPGGQPGARVALLAAARLQLQMSEVQHEQLLDHLEEHVETLTLGQLADAIWAACQLSQMLGRKDLLWASGRRRRLLMPLLLSLSQSHMESCMEHRSTSPSQLGRMLAGLTAVGVRLPPAWCFAHESAVLQLSRAGVITLRQGAALSRMYVRVGYPPERLHVTLKAWADKHRPQLPQQAPLDEKNDDDPNYIADKVDGTSE